MTCRGMGSIMPTEAITKHGVQSVRPESEGSARPLITLSCGKTCRRDGNEAKTDRTQIYSNEF